MGASTVSVIEKLLKNKYRDIMPVALREEFIGWQLAKPQSRSFSGNVEYFPVKMALGAGVATRGEVGGAIDSNYAGLPLPGAPKYDQGYVGLKRMFGTLQWSAEAILRCKDDEGSYKRLITSELEDKFTRFQRELSFQFFGDGRGRRCTVSGNTNGSAAITTGQSGDVKVDTTRYLNVGDMIELWASDDATRIQYGGGDTDTAEKVWIKAIKDETTITVQNDSAQTFTATDDQFVRVYGESTLVGSTRVDNAFTGLSAIVDDGTLASTYAGLSRTTYPQWKSYVKDLSAANLSEDQIITAADAVARKYGKQATPNVLLMDLSLRREYVQITKPDRRYAPLKDLDPGYEEEALVLTAGKRKFTIIEDADAPYGVVFGINKKELEYYELSPLQIDDSTGSILKMGTAYGKAGTGHVYWAMVSCYGNFACPAPFRHFKLTNLAYTLES